MNTNIVRTILLIALFLNSICAHAQQQFRWAKGGGTVDALPTGYDREAVRYMCTDPNGNVYALSTVGRDPVTADTFSHPGSGYRTSLLLTSYTCDGTMRWAKLLAGTGEDFPSGITCDNAGHIYVSGYFAHVYGTTTFRIGYDTTITGYIYLTEGLIQLDTSGNYKWIRFIGANTVASLSATSAFAPLAIDAVNNVHQFPYVEAGVPFMTSVTSIGGVYDLTYTPSGTLLSAVRLDMDSQWEAKSVVIDPVTNKLYVTGEINQFIFGGFLTDTFYAAAFDGSRNKLWQHFCGVGSGVTGITLGQDKHLYFSGAANGAPFSFNGGFVTAGNLAVVMKTDTNGSVKWLKSFHNVGSGVSGFWGITSLPNNKVAAVGTFAGKLWENGTIFCMSTPPGEGYTPYVVILDSAKDLQEAKKLHANGFYNFGMAITADKKGNIYLGGEVADSVWATGPKVPAYHGVGGNGDFFVVKYGVDCSCTSMPVSSFTYSGTHTLSVSYTGTSTGLDSVVWNFGDGSATVKGLTAAHTYTLTGTYRVTATVYTTCGNDIHGENVFIACGLPPTAAFTSAGVHTVSFTYTGTTSTVDSTTWDFGDGSPAVKGSTAAHTYAATGVYTACVTAWSACGNNTTCKTVTIVCLAAPAAAFTKTGVYNINTTYTGTTAGIDSVVWDFGDGTPKVKGSTAAHTYTAIGIYTICAAAYTPCGADTVCRFDTVECIAAPIAAFSDTGKTIFGFAYTGTTTAIDSIVWDFGDTTTATGLTALHTYKKKGTYRVCVTAYSPCGKDSACKDIKVISLLGISQTETVNILVYPNPANDELIVEGAKEREVSIYNIVGQRVYNALLRSDKEALYVGSLAPGVYVARLTDMNGQVQNVRFVKE